MFTAVSAAAIAKNGRTRRKSRKRNGRSHQMITRSSTGETATEPLLSIANTNAARLNQYQRQKDEG